MVLFRNLNVGQEVEVLHQGEILPAKVRYLGGLCLRPGDWVGLEMREPLGDTDGLYRGRRYFFCRQFYGIFTTSSRIRFKPMLRSSKNNYVKVDNRSEIEEELFPTEPPALEDPNDPINISQDYWQVSSMVFDRPRTAGEALFQYKTHPLGHKIGSTVPAATMNAQQSKRSLGSPSRRPIYTSYMREREFISPPSVPDYHIPADVLRRQLDCGYVPKRIPKTHNVYTFRDNLHTSRDWWNDVY